MNKTKSVTKMVLILPLLMVAASFSYADRTTGNHAAARKTVQAAHRRAVVQRTNGTTTRTITRPDGATAIRTATVDRDRENKRLTRHVEGTRFDGDSYSSQQTVQRTENGVTVDGTRTNAKGNTIARHVDTTVDREAGTVTKEVEITDRNGEVHNHTVVRNKGQDQEQN